ncbi:MAG: hypothetical protein D6733_07845 [Methanobacteriota archaeon]|nr:MAG: hypothetical protein D6733_07845 [Euryarchaeota archaeon]
MEVTELFSKGLDVFKKNPVIAVPLIAVGVIIGVLTLALVGGMMAGIGMMGMGGMSPGAGFGAIMGVGLLIVVIGGLLNLTAMGMTYVMADDALAGQADLNTGLQKTLGNIVNLLIASILLAVIIGIGFMLLFLPGLILAYLLMFTLPLVVLDNKGPVAALQESFELVKNNISETIVFAVIAAVIMFIAKIIGGILGLIPLLGVVLISPIVSGAAGAYISIVLVLLYKELKK